MAIIILIVYIDLKIGVTLPCFHSDGKTPVTREVFKTTVK